MATYNLENYHLFPGPDRPLKPPEARAQILANLLAIRPDVLALQELGSPADLEDLASGLRAGGLDLPHHLTVPGHDTNIMVGVLSRFPFERQRLHTNEQFLLDGRRLRMSRGVAEVEVSPAPGYRFALFTAHLKSRRQEAAFDEAELRDQEAKTLRALIDERLAAEPAANVVVCGDFNDTPDSRPIRRLLSRGKRGLIDTRPSERENRPDPGSDHATHRSVTWTHFYAKEDTYSRIDYILLSPGMAREWLPAESYVYATPDWGLASDHRPVVAAFSAADR